MSPSLSSFLRFCAGAFLATQLGAEPFEPDVDFSLTEKWRWHELEPLSEFLIERGTEDADGNLVFTGKENLIVYDGYETRLIPYPISAEDFNAYDILMSQNGRLYLNSSYGVFSWHDDQWNEEIAHRHQILNVRPTFARNGLGLEVVAVPSGLYFINGETIEKFEGIDDEFSSISFDRQNRLWAVVAADREIRQIQFDGLRPSRPYSHRSFLLDYDGNVFPSIIASPASNEVWSVNWRPLIPAFKFDEKSQDWMPRDLTPLVGNNRHTYGYHLNETDMVIFSKTAILVKHLETWHSIEYPAFDFPTNQPFYILRANGKLVLGGRGEKIYEIDYNSQHQDSFHGLHFQCDVQGRNRWFISIEGHIIEQDTIYNTWNRHTDNVIDTPLVILKSDDDTIWAAGSHRGTAAVSYYNGRNWTRELFPKLNSMISHMSARQLPNGDILFGSGEDNPLSPEGGLIIFRHDASGYTSHHYGPPQVPARPVGVGISSPDQLWFGGRRIVNAHLQTNTPFKIVGQFNQQLWFDDVSEDDQGNIWVALWEQGVFSYDGENWTSHSQPAQIASSQVSYILKDRLRPHNLWFATDRGISRFDGNHWYPQALPSELRFHRESGSLRQSSDGAIWVNVATRDWFFRKATNFYITKRLHDTFKTVRYAPDKSPPVVAFTSSISRATSPANILIEWTGVDKWSHTPVDKLKYTFRLNDEPWSEFIEGNRHVLLEVPSGTHQFHLQALDLDGNLSAIASTPDFVVVLPVWQRTWFVTLAIITLITIVGLVILLFRQRIRHVVQLDEFKLQFFTNISHELRTPLTVILGPIESQLAKFPPHWDRKPLEIAYKNARRTLALIDQLLDFRSAETGNIKINLARSDLIATTREIIHLLKPLVDERAQTLDFHCEVEKCVVWFDAEIVEKILNNLISNAVKYTQQSGHIDVHFSTIDEGDKIIAQFVVKDNGSGIPREEIDHIFEAFVRSRHRGKRSVRGSGIGLAFTKKLIETCDGAISVASPVAKVNGRAQGSRFTVTLPLRKASADSHGPFAVARDTPDSEPELDEESMESVDQRPLLLIVEDDDEIREFLHAELKDQYQVSSASDGELALDIATKRIPDLIVTDVMMPEIDGKELCRRIKSNESTSHIPIIMLTALKSELHELEGLEIGADDYLSKPLRLSILKKRIHNLLESRRKLQNRFQQQKSEATVAPHEITTNPVDEAFMNKAVTTVEQQLEDPLFDVEAFAEQMFMSRMTLYRKMKAITGDSPSNFIRSIRMNKAAALLATKQYNVSETADRVGLPDLSSFSTAFKRHFKVSPSQYVTRKNPPR